MGAQAKGSWLDHFCRLLRRLAPADLWVGAGRAFRDEPLDSTLIVLHAHRQAQPWALLTDTPVAQTEPTLSVCLPQLD